MEKSDSLFTEHKTKKIVTAAVVFLVLLRIAVGWHLLYEGLSKLYTPGWSAAEYLALSRWWFAPVFNWIAGHPVILNIVNFINIWGLVAAGAGLMLGLFSRTAGIAGAALIFLYYISNPPLVGLDYGVPAEGNYLIINKNIIELIVLVILSIVPTGRFFGLDRLVARYREYKKNRKQSPAGTETAGEVSFLKSLQTRREALLTFGWLPFLFTFLWSLIVKYRWESYEEQNLVDAMTSASMKTFDISTLSDLKGQIPYGKIKDTPFSRIILGGNLLSGYTHSRDLIYVSQLVKTYHHKDKIFATLYMAEQCGVNTLLTNPIMATMIDEYWKRKIGNIQFISDCAGLIYGKTIEAEPFDVYLDRIRRAIDYGACACYIQGETADYYMEHGMSDQLGKAMELIRENNLLLGIGAHRIETIKACVEAGFDPDFWMKTLHHHNYWSAKHPEWHDNTYCFNPAETIAYMETLPQPWMAFKVMAAGAIHPRDAFKYAFEKGADFICAGMYDFQMVEDINIAFDALNSDIQRKRNWMA
ncbi:DoxX family protein [Candidatus Latescibacterota bacterium]